MAGVESAGKSPSIGPLWMRPAVACGDVGERGCGEMVVVSEDVPINLQKLVIFVCNPL